MTTTAAQEPFETHRRRGPQQPRRAEHRRFVTHGRPLAGLPLRRRRPDLERLCASRGRARGGTARRPRTQRASCGCNRGRSPSPMAVPETMAGPHDDFGLFIRLSRDEGQTWLPEVRINLPGAYAPSYHNAMIQLGSGRLVFPVRWILRRQSRRPRRPDPCLGAAGWTAFPGRGSRPPAGDGHYICLLLR